MRSDEPVNLEHFLQLGRRFQTIRNGIDTEKPNKDSSELINSFSEPSASACSERWFFEHLEPQQIDHFRDWLLINSTCRDFRTWGKPAFFSGKIFVIRPPILKNLLGKGSKSISAENKATALRHIRHVIAPLPYHFATSQIVTLPRYNALENLRSLTIRMICADREIILKVDSPALKRCPLPENLSSLLRDLGLPVDHLQTDLQYYIDERKHHDLMTCLAGKSYHFLRVMLARMARVPTSVSDGMLGR